MAPRSGDFWPSALQESLFRVALGDEAVAARAWRLARTGLELDALEPGTFSLLPPICRPVSRIDPGYEQIGVLKGLYRKTWYTNQLRASTLRPLLGELAGHGFDTLLVGGIAVAGRYYRDLGLRPSGEASLLVRARDLVPLAALLQRDGWTSVAADSAGRIFSREGSFVVLITSFAPDFRARRERPQVAEEVWECACPLIGAGVDGLGLSPTDELLAAIAAGTRPAGGRTVQCLLDAAMIARSEPGEIEWERLVRTAVHYRQGLRARDALSYLAELPGVTVPQAVLDELAALSTKRWALR